jgi:hypothetical protein
MDAALVRLVWTRARDCCEYCRMPQAYDTLTFEIDHVIALKHRGPTRAENLALACFLCNNSKGPNIAGLDPVTRKLTKLYNPRRHKWRRHFRWDGPLLVGKTPVGRTTVAVLEMNLPHRVAHREALIDEGVFPPPEDLPA